MSRRTLRRYLPALLIVLVAGLALGVLSASSSSSTVTRARLERSLPTTFSNLYVQQAKLLGHKGVTAQSLHARAQCDKGGPNVPDHGPGADWICMMKWHDPNIDETLLPGKFEVNVHSNDCYTAGGPSKIVGLLTITDKAGRDVPNPVFEFDGCFDPRASNRPTGVVFPTTTSSTTATPTPAALSFPTGAATAHGGRIRLTLQCSAGDGGCAGSLTASAGGRPIGTQTYIAGPGKTVSIGFALPTRPQQSSQLTVVAKPVIGTAPPAPTTITIGN